MKTALVEVLEVSSGLAQGKGTLKLNESCHQSGHSLASTNLAVPRGSRVAVDQLTPCVQ